MYCTKCGKEIPDESIVCPNCNATLNKDVKFNDFKEDGFVHLEIPQGEKSTSSKTSEENENSPKLANNHIFIIAIIFIAIIAIGTIFGLDFLREKSDQRVEYATEVTQPSTDIKINSNVENTVKDLSFKDVQKIWRKSSDTPRENFYVPFFNFEENHLKIECGTIDSVAHVFDYSTEDENIIFISSNNYLTGYFYFNVSGNDKDGYTMILKNKVSKKSYVFNSVEEQIVATAEPQDEFKSDERLIGKWTNSDSMNYIFNEDGTYSRYTDGLYVEGEWSVQREGYIELTYVENTKKTKTVDYDFKNDYLIIVDNVYEKES